MFDLVNYCVVRVIIVVQVYERKAEMSLHRYHGSLASSCLSNQSAEKWGGTTLTTY